MQESDGLLHRAASTLRGLQVLHCARDRSPKVSNGENAMADGFLNEVLGSQWRSRNSPKRWGTHPIVNSASTRVHSRQSSSFRLLPKSRADNRNQHWQQQ